MDTPTGNNNKARNFNRAYDGTDMYYGWDVRPEFDAFFKKMDLTGRAALDRGAGEGRYAIYLAKQGCAVTAVDFSSSGLNKLKTISGQQQLHVDTELCDLSDYTFRQNAYDLIVAATILDHLETPVRGLFMAGDGPGVAGNIVSATATALIPAKEIISRY